MTPKTAPSRSEETKEAKSWLYCLLLGKERNKLTDSEIDIMYNLSLDKDIQEILEDARRKNTNL